MQDPSPKIKKQAEERLRQSFQQLDSQKSELLKQEYDGDRAALLLQMVGRNFGKSILEVRKMFLERNVKGAVIAQVLEKEMIVVPLPLEEINPEDEDEFIRGLKQAYSKSDPNKFVVVGVVTAALDSAYGVFDVKELSAQKANPDFETWESEIANLIGE